MIDKYEHGTNNSPASVDETSSITVKRTHGLGNVLCLLPALDCLANDGYQITVITRPEWLYTFSTIRPKFTWTCDTDDDAINLDELTCDLMPSEHRSDESGRLLGVPSPLPTKALRLNIPLSWSENFAALSGAIVFAPEGGHRSRYWPYCGELGNALEGRNLVLVGLDDLPAINCQTDLRGQLQLHELFGLMAVASVVVTMDSAALHIAGALKIATVAIFGGIDPKLRLRGDQQAVVLHGDVDCCPCNKNETCHGSYHCISAVTVKDVTNAIAIAPHTDNLVIRAVPALRRDTLAE